MLDKKKRKMSNKSLFTVKRDVLETIDNMYTRSDQSEQNTTSQATSLPLDSIRSLRAQRNSSVTSSSLKSKESNLYKFNVYNSKYSSYPPKRLVFNLMKKKWKPPKSQETYTKSELEQKSEKENVLPQKVESRIDFYYFDHGNSQFLRTINQPPLALTQVLADKTEEFTTKFWAEIFGSINIGFSFVTGFVLGLFRFVLCSVIRPLTIGLIQLFSDYFLKPCLTTSFNGIVQPSLLFLYNIATSLRDLSEPLAQLLAYFLKSFATVLASCRLFEIKQYNVAQNEDEETKVDYEKEEESPRTSSNDKE